MGRLGRLVVLSLICALTTPGMVLAQGPPAATPLASLSVSALIDRLTQVEFAHLYATATLRTGRMNTASLWFLPLDWVEPQRSFFEFDSEPDQPEVLRELVRRGAPAVPHLLAHLDDKRPTQIRSPGLRDGGMVDPEDPKKPATLEAGPPLDTVAVGDLCYLVLGQIVNREYSVLQSGPFSIQWMASLSLPSRCPALRNKVRKEWATLTRE